MTTSSLKPYLTSAEVAALFMVSPVTVRQWAQHGQLPSATTPGGHRRYSPRDVAAFAKARGIVMANRAAHGARVLVTDDDIAFSRYLSERLSMQTEVAAVELAHDGFEAGLKVEMFQPDIILLDMMMPDLDGLSVCKKIKAQPITAGIRIIAMTGYYTANKAATIVAAGAETCLAKPFSKHDLLQVLGWDGGTAEYGQQDQHAS